jgi:hypothetical protein
VTSTGDFTVTNSTIQFESEASLTSTAGSIFMNPASLLVVNADGFRASLVAANAVELGQVNAPRIYASGTSATVGGNLQSSYGSITVLATSGTLSVSDNVSISSIGPTDANGYGYYAGDISLTSQSGSVSIGNGVQIYSKGGDSAGQSGGTAYAGGNGGNITLTMATTLGLAAGSTIQSVGGTGGDGVPSASQGVHGGVGGKGGNITLTGSGVASSINLQNLSTVQSKGGQGGNGAQGGDGASGVVAGAPGVGGGNGGDGGKGGQGGDVTLSAGTLTLGGDVWSVGGDGGNGALGGNGGNGATGNATLAGGKGGSGGSAGWGGKGGDSGTVAISNTVASGLTLSGARVVSAAGSGGFGNDAGVAGSGGASGGFGAGLDGDPGYDGYQGYSGSSGLVSIQSFDTLSLSGTAIVRGGSADLQAVNALSIANSYVEVESAALIKSDNGDITMSGLSTITSTGTSRSSDIVELKAINGAIQVTKISAPAIKIKGDTVTLLTAGSLASAYGGLISVESTGGSLTVQDNVTIRSVADADRRGGDITLQSTAGQLTIGSGVSITSVGGNGYGADWSGDSDGRAGDGGDIVLAGRTGVTMSAGANTNIYARGGIGGDGIYASTHNGPDGGDGGAGGSISISSSNGNVFFIGNNVTLVSIGGNGGRGADGSTGADGVSLGDPAGTGGMGYNGGNGGLGGNGGTISLSGSGITFKGAIASQGGTGGAAGAGGQGGTGGSASGTGGNGGDGGDAGAAGQGGDGGNIVMSASSGSITLTAGQVNSIGGDGGVGASGGAGGLGGFGGDTSGMDGLQGADNLSDGPSGTYGAISLTSSGGVSLATLSMRGGSVSILASNGNVDIGNGVAIQADNSVDVTSATGSIYMTGSARIELLSNISGDLVDLRAANDVQLTYLNGYTMNVVGTSIYSDASYIANGDNLKGSYAFLGDTLLSDVGSMTRPLQVNLGLSGALTVHGKDNVWISSLQDLSIGAVQVGTGTGSSGTISVASSGVLTVYTGTTGGISTGDVGVHLSGVDGVQVGTSTTVRASGTGNLDIDSNGTVHVEGGAMSVSGDINITSGNVHLRQHQHRGQHRRNRWHGDHRLRQREPY